MPFELARCLCDCAVILGPSEPDARAAADEGREILGRLGARAYLARFEAAFSAGAGGEPAPEAKGQAAGRPEMVRAGTAAAGPSPGS
jgi:hypothetical protein